MPARRPKRALEVVDLREDGPSPQKKAPRHTASSYPTSTQSSTQSSLLPHEPPASSGPANLTPDAHLLLQQLDHDEERVTGLDSTQSEDGPPRELYGTLITKIVGVRYYNGFATPGETVICMREPSNPYDSNAIRVDNVLYQQIGHLPRTVAKKLAPYLDADEIELEAYVNGSKGEYDCPLRIQLYGPVYDWWRVPLEERLKKDKLLKAGDLKQTRHENEARRELGLKNGGGTAGIARGGPKTGLEEVSLQQLAQASQAVDFRSGSGDIRSLVMDEDQLAKMVMAQQPEKIRAILLPYQLQGLAWLMSKENPKFPPAGSDDSIQLWKRKGQRYLNLATNFVTSQTPGLVSGGILADDMGLGKTLQIISLIMSGEAGATLIVAPLGVMSNWQQQIERHVLEEHAPNVLVYHGNVRQTKKLSEYDVVITTYGTMSSESDAGALFKIKWKRIVLDEGHNIRNSKIKAATAACKLEAESRWVLTGTPIINNVKDLHSLLRFLRITGGIEKAELFHSAIARGLSHGEETSELLLQSLMADLSLRRKKDMKFVDLKLPPKKEFVYRTTFWPEEKKKYDALLTEAKGDLEEIQKRINGKKSGSRYQIVLERLLRLRQMCQHWTLCKQRIIDVLKDFEDQAVVPLTEENRILLQQALQLLIESQEDCAVCIDFMTDPVITHCKHAFCRACISKVVEVQKKCPLCRAELSVDKLLDPPRDPSAKEEEQALDAETKSSKTEALLKILQATLKKKGSKVIIFSQWTSFLTVIQRQLEEAGYKYTRIDGSMNVSQRDAAIKTLDKDADTRVLLASLAVCSVGLNLVSADTVILADSWWAPAIEDQAVDRVHRLGQTRATTVWRLVMEGTVEERVLDIQAEKRELVSRAFQEKQKSGKKTKEARMVDILKLLA